MQIGLDGKQVAHERRKAQPAKRFVSEDYAIPDALTRGKSKVAVRFETRGSDAPVTSFALSPRTREPADAAAQWLWRGTPCTCPMR